MLNLLPLFSCSTLTVSSLHPSHIIPTPSAIVICHLELQPRDQLTSQQLPRRLSSRCRVIWSCCNEEVYQPTCYILRSYLPIILKLLYILFCLVLYAAGRDSCRLCSKILPCGNYKKGKILHEFIH